MAQRHAEIERHLFTAIELLRPVTDDSSARDILVALLFLKGCSDAFQLRYREVLKEQLAEGCSQSDAEKRANHPSYYADVGCLFVPLEARWQQLADATLHHVADRLNMASAVLEEANPSLEGVLTHIDFNQKMSRSQDKNRTLNDLIRLLSELPQQGEAPGYPRIVAQAFELAIRLLPTEEKRSINNFYAPNSVARLMTSLCQPKTGETVYDPTCGSGGLLLEAVRFMERSKMKPDSISLYGQEIDRRTRATCKMRLVLWGLEKALIAQGNTLLEPMFLAIDKRERFGWAEFWKNRERSATPSKKTVERFDVVLANPPFGLKKWGHESWARGDSFGRDRYGCPPKHSGDLAFLQHVVASLRPGGRAAVVCHCGPLFRGGAEQKIREGLINDDVVDTVIGLAHNLFYSTTAQTSVIVLCAPGSKPIKRQGKVLFIHANSEFRKTQGQNRLEPEHLQKILAAWVDFEDIPDFATVVSDNEIETFDFNLNPAYYQLRWQEKRLERQFDDATVQELADLTIEFSTTSKGQDVSSAPNTLYLSKTGRPLLARSGSAPRYRGAHKLTLDSAQIDAGYLAAFFASEPGQAIVKSMASGTAVSRISRKALHRIPVPLPDLGTQRAIAKTDEELHGLQRGIDRLRTRFTLNLRNLDRIDSEIAKIREAIQKLEESDDIRTLIERGESKQVEFKAALAWDDRGQKKDGGIARRILREVAAFMNSEGGVLLIGVHDDGSIRGVDVELNSCFKGNRDDLLLFWKDKLKNSIGEPAFTLVDYSLRGIGEREILLVECKPSPKEVFLNGAFYIRMHPSAEKIVGQDLVDYCRKRFPYPGN